MDYYVEIKKVGIKTYPARLIKCMERVEVYVKEL